MSSRAVPIDTRLAIASFERLPYCALQERAVNKVRYPFLQVPLETRFEPDLTTR